MTAADRNTTADALMTTDVEMRNGRNYALVPIGLAIDAARLLRTPDTPTDSDTAARVESKIAGEGEASRKAGLSNCVGSTPSSGADDALASGTAARARALLDAIELPATATRDERLAAIQSFPVDSYVKVGHPHNGEVFKRVDVKPGQMAGLIALGYHREGDAGQTATQRVTSWADRAFKVELIAAAPTLITDLLTERDAAVARADALTAIIDGNHSLTCGCGECAARGTDR